MIVCPTCKTVMTSEKCSCGFQIVDKNGITSYGVEVSESYENYHADRFNATEDIEEKHFWFIARYELINKFFKKNITQSKRIIDVGSGTGKWAFSMQEIGYQIAVGEIHLAGLQIAQEYGVKQLNQIDIFQNPFIEEYDVVTMFDVLEHFEDDISVIQSVKQTLKDDGYFILTVPASMLLWNRDDVIASHKRRYSKNELEMKLKNAGFTIKESKYFFISIFPLLLLRRFLNSDDGSEIKDYELKKTFKLNPIINIILLFITKIENKYIDYLPNFFGGSIIIVAQKSRV